MPVMIECPACQTRLKVPDAVPARVQCPKCQLKFSGVEAAARAAGVGAEPEAFERPPIIPQRPAGPPADGLERPPIVPQRPARPAQPPAPPQRPRVAEPRPQAYDDLESLQESELATLPPARSAPRPARREASAPAGPGIGRNQVRAGVAVLSVAALGLAWTFGGGRLARNPAQAPPEEPPHIDEQARLDETTPPPGTPFEIPKAPEVLPAPPPLPPAAVAVAPPPPALSGEQIVDALKEATVYIKHKARGGPTLTSGTGYVIEQTGGTLWIATNRHVAVPDLSELPEGVLKPGQVVEMLVVVRSGQPDEEQVLPAKLVAADPSSELENDVAFLTVSGVRKPPKPLRLQVAMPAREGMSYIGAGFPLGGMVNSLTQDAGNPSITITRGGIAAVRKDPNFGQVKLIQVDGSLQPGNSGGPIVDGSTGRFLGMAVAKATAADTIGFLVPPDRIRQALAGTVGQTQVQVDRLDAQGADLTVLAVLFDPRNRLGEVRVNVAPAASARGMRQDAGGAWGPLPNAATSRLLPVQNPDGERAMAGRVQARFDGDRTVAIQTAHNQETGGWVYDAPRLVTIPDRTGPILPPNSIERLGERLIRRSLEKLGPLIDPDQDCHLTKDLDAGTVAIKVSPKLHTLAPEARKGKKPLNNAPMTLTEVSGEFLAMVAVTGKMNPGTEPPPLPEGVVIREESGKTRRKLEGTFQGAGLILYQDDANYLRLERASFTRNGRPVLEQKILLEIVQKGKHTIEPVYLPVPEAEMRIALLRREGRVSGLVIVGDALGVSTKELLVDFPDTVKVGLIASNVSQKPLEARFEGFVLIDEKAKIDQTLGGLGEPRK